MVEFWQKPSYWFIAYAFLLCPHKVQGGKASFWSLFYKGTNHIHEGSTLMTYAPPNTITLAVRIST